MALVLKEAGLRNLLVLPHGTVGRYVTQKAEATAEIARQNVRSTFRTRTGNLERSIGTYPNEGPEGLQVEVGTQDAPYGKILEQGSGPHSIWARRVEFLWSLDQNPNHPDPLNRHDLRVVDHPGIYARPWLFPALQQVIRG